ncbi:MAG: MerR family transcriptional regulator [Lachnospiraceae bacterium]|nr:MerR family transcriptional regulator [Lachnospiraceae bacterium]
MDETRYMISDAAKQIDVESHVLRYWEEELEMDIPRNEMGHRYYREVDIETMRAVKRLKDQGYQLKLIKMILPEIERIEQLEPGKLLSLREQLELVTGLGPVGGKDTSASGTGGMPTEGAQGTKGAQPAERIQPAEETRAAEVARAAEGAQAAERTQGMKRVQPAEKISAEKNSEHCAPALPEVAAAKEGNQGETVQTGIPDAALTQEEKLLKFREIMGGIVSDAVVSNNGRLTRAVSESVSEKVIKEMDYLMRIQEEKEEERYRQLDQTIREYQQGKAQTAAAREKKKRKGLFAKRSAK